eukprot:GHUV01032640.1.p5 GENE.GHUV01032640.1~~GHUV01032640.1.p5  ORF type:complete len:112 (+),score=41.29 GHUV01032640.1:1396-1731(+)
MTANITPATSRPLPFPEDAVLRGASDCGNPRMHGTAVPTSAPAAAVASAPGPPDHSGGFGTATGCKEVRKPRSQGSSDVPAVPYNLRGPSSANLKHRRGSSASGGSSSSGQ